MVKYSTWDTEKKVTFFWKLKPPLKHAFTVTTMIPALDHMSGWQTVPNV